jgi:hypothetical protein
MQHDFNNKGGLKRKKCYFKCLNIIYRGSGWVMLAIAITLCMLLLHPYCRRFTFRSPQKLLD